MKVRNYLALITASLLIPLVLLFGVGLSMLHDAEQAAALTSLQEATRATAVSVDQELSKAEAALRVLATSVNLKNRDYDAFHTQARIAVADPDTWIVLFDETGQQLVNTALPAGSRLPVSAHKSWITRTIAEQKTVVQDLQQGTVTKKWITSILVPARQADGRQYVLAHVFTAEYFKRVFPRTGQGAKWLNAIFDREGKTIARSHGASLVGELPREDLLQAIRSSNTSFLKNQSRDGVHLYTTLAKSSVSGWTIAVGAPKADIERAVQDALKLGLLGLFVALILGGALATLFGRQLIRSITDATTALAALGSGETAPRYRSGIEEVAQLQAAQQKAETSLVEQQNRIQNEIVHLRHLMNQAPGFNVFLRGPEHRFEFVNDAYYQLVGHRVLLGRPIRDALPEVAGQGFFELLDQVYATGQPFVGHAMPVTLHKEVGGTPELRYVDFVYQPVFDDQNNVIGIFSQGTDVTEHKLASNELAKYQTKLEELVTERTLALQRSQEALVHAQKLEALGKLTGGVAHDFNNVLQIISANVEMLRFTLAGDEKAKARLDITESAVDRGAKLSSHLLSFARRQALQPSVTDLRKLVKGIDEMLRQVLGADIEIETILAGGLWHTEVDRSQLENVIINLAVNARDAMPEGGKLTIEVANSMLDDAYVMTQQDVKAGQYVLLALSDTGTGMPPEVIARAIEPFFTTKPEGVGTGLGLSMAYGFVKQSGGHLRIYSEVDVGTTVKIYLPRVTSDEDNPPTEPHQSAPEGDETILVVEDDPDVRANVIDMLRSLGYRVLSAANGEEGLTIVKSGSSIDLIFTDVVMPGAVRSIDMARQAKLVLPKVEVLFTSGYTQNAIVHGGRLDKGVALLSKPYRRDDLARKIRSLLGSRLSQTDAAG